MDGLPLAFEENRWFAYALADMSARPSDEDGTKPQPVVRQFRRILLLKPSTVVVEDVIWPRNPELSIRWMLRSVAEPKVEVNRFKRDCRKSQTHG